MVSYIWRMKEQDRKIRIRIKWLEIYTETGSVTKTAIRYGITRSTLYRWIKREKEHGELGLSDKYRRPFKLINSQITSEIENVILDIRKNKRWGVQRIANYLLRKKIRISTMTVWRVLHNHQVKSVVKRHEKSEYLRYSKEVPREKGINRCYKNMEWSLPIYSDR